MKEILNSEIEQMCDVLKPFEFISFQKEDLENFIKTLKEDPLFNSDSYKKLEELTNKYYNFVMKNFLFANRKVTLVDFQGFGEDLKDYNLNDNLDKFKDKRNSSLHFLIHNAILLGMKVERERTARDFIDRTKED